MFPGSSSGLSLVKIISGISKSLNIAREVIPIYQQAKPMITNAKKAFGVLKDFNLKSNNNAVSNNKTTSETRDSLVINNINNPTFFK